MGQQQLLLLVLGIVIVGLAVVVGINAFGENQKRANADALVNDGLRIASDLQAYALKPTQFSGAGGWSGVDVTDEQKFWNEALGYSTESFDEEGNPDPDGDNSRYSNVNGSFQIEGDGTNGVLITGENTDQDNQVYIRVCGVTANDILTRIDYNTGEAVTAPTCP